MPLFKMNFIVFILLVASSLSLSHARVFSRCDLARELLRQGFPRHQLNDWICLAEHESSLNTQAINRNNVDGSWDYGLFQLNSRYWCQGQVTQSNGCNVNCNAFLSDDISVASRCARQIYNAMGFPAWVAWKKSCNGFNLSQYTAGCGV